ncbi:S1 family peptidase [Actinophytocola gossypii]|uniref:Peptidase S1 n=1 Tax=Actinophytocola gossypii TaxID=2812003 RepID=A0ABT2J8J0_9PSEU|nr:S1 family peptidase [Actinophytocola gossypii]MCT2584180.1 peptidase S1 [Actinophytocola gossypii]
MRRLLATLTVLFACLLGLPATAGAAAPAPLGGGAVLYDPVGTGRCTASFAAVRGSEWLLITERACAGAGELYSGDHVPVGKVVATTSTYALVQVTNTTDWELVPWIDTGSGKVLITGSRETPVGGPVCLVDHALGYQCGTVTARNQTIVFPEGAVYGLTRTNVCASAHAVAFLSGGQAQGVPVAASGTCTTGGTSWFQPVNPILAAYGLTLLTG